MSQENTTCPRTVSEEIAAIKRGEDSTNHPIVTAYLLVPDEAKIMARFAKVAQAASRARTGLRPIHIPFVM